jgi:predicted methyltransferase
MIAEPGHPSLPRWRDSAATHPFRGKYLRIPDFRHPIPAQHCRLLPWKQMTQLILAFCGAFRHYFSSAKIPSGTFFMRQTSRALRVLLLAILVLLGMFACPPAALAGQNSGTERDAWQHPKRVMDALAIHAGSAVADVGCGRGYFTFKFATRVGRQGKVYAVDIDEFDLESIRHQAARERLTQIETVHGALDDPHLPADSLDAVLVMNAYHEFRDHQAMLAGIYRALKPGGLLALIDGAAPVGHPRDYYDGMHRLPEIFEREDALRAGFKFLYHETGFTRTNDGKQFYFLIFLTAKP